MDTCRLQCQARASRGRPPETPALTLVAVGGLSCAAMCPITHAFVPPATVASLRPCGSRALPATPLGPGSWARTKGTGAQDHANILNCFQTFFFLAAID